MAEVGYIQKICTIISADCRRITTFVRVFLLQKSQHRRQFVSNTSAIFGIFIFEDPHLT